MDRDLGERKQGLRLCTAAFVFLLFAWLFTCSFTGAATAAGTVAQQTAPASHTGHEGMDMSMDMPMDAVAMANLQAKVLADKNESEFNHHLAGFFVMIAGVFIFFQENLQRGWHRVKYVWPACFLLAGVFVLVWSDTELWPFGHRQWFEALQNNREVLQHKTFAAMLLCLGLIEWQRALGALKAAWSNWIFPAIAVAGSLLLIFHQHEGGMIGEHHMETMERIQSEHMSYLVCGLGIGLSNGLSAVNTRFNGVFKRMWPILMVVLGVLLTFYKE